MIVISTYNPDTKRTTQDESCLTTLLTSLVHYRARLSVVKAATRDIVQKQHFEEEVINADRLIGLVFPLLGLSITEVLDLIELEAQKWQTDLTGKK